MVAEAEFSTPSRARKLVKAETLLEAGFLYSAASRVRKERERANAEQAEADLRAIERLTEQMRARLSGARLERFNEWVAIDPYAVQERSDEELRSELSRIAIGIAVATVLLLLAAFVLPHGPTIAIGGGLFLALSLLPIYVANRVGEARGRRDQWIWGMFLSWVGVLVVVLRPRRQ